VTGGTGDDVTTSMLQGRMRGLLDLRDKQIPAMLDQLDSMASTLRDQFNALHNSGSGFPGTSSYTGTRAVNAMDFSQWSGSVRIALLDGQGQPVASPFTDETNGLAPLTMDMSKLFGDNGQGKPSTQDIINEINAKFAMPQNKASIGSLNNLRLVSDSPTLPGIPAQLTFDFDAENLSGSNANLFVRGITIKDDTGADMTSVTSTMPASALAPTSTFSTVAGSTTVTVHAASGHTFHEGDRVYLSQLGGAVNGIPASDFDQYFTVSNVTATSFEIAVDTPAATTGNADFSGAKATGAYQNIATGTQVRTHDSGLFTANLSANSASKFYTVTADVGVQQPDGTVKVATISYKILNPNVNGLNQRYAANAVTGDATLSSSNTTQPLLRAMLVDANGNELPKTNGAYVSSQNGYLKLVASNSTYTIAIDSMDSKQLGLPNQSPVVAGTNRSFAHYFELNNFFQSNQPTATGDTLRNSALNLKVEARMADNPSLLSTGVLSLSAQPVDPNQAPNYTYRRLSGDNSLLQQLAQLGNQNVAFKAAGGIASLNVSFNGYAGNILGFAATTAENADSNLKSAQSLADGFSSSASAASGVNLDQELGNTIIYQSAYSASARIVTITNQLFDTLLQAFG
jgi:flagellar hook-associated protein FlgK